jgi:hypothetical protein
MPHVSANLASNVRISVTLHFLRKSVTIEILEGFVDPNDPGARLYDSTCSIVAKLQPMTRESIK